MTLSDPVRCLVVSMHSQQGRSAGSIARYLRDTLKLDVDDSTVRKMLAQWRDSGRTEPLPHFLPPPPVCISEETKEEIARLQDSDPRLTQSDIRSLLPAPAPSRSTISRVIKAKSFTTKLLEVSVDARNSERVQLQRVQFIHTAEERLTEENSIFIDETPWSRTR